MVCDLCPLPWIGEFKLDSGEKDIGLEEDEPSNKLWSVDTLVPLWGCLDRCAGGDSERESFGNVKEHLSFGDKTIGFLAAYVLESIASLVSAAVEGTLPLSCSLSDTGSVLVINPGRFGLALQLGSVQVVPLDTQDFAREPTMGATVDAAEQAMQEDMLTGLMGQQGE